MIHNLISQNNIDLKLSTELHTLAGVITSLSSVNKNDLTIALETFLIPMFNLIYDTIFINLNEDIINFPGIDLYSRKKKIAIQITSNESTAKISDTLIKVEKIVKNKDIEIENLYIFILSSKKYRKIFPKYDYFDNENILTINTILKYNMSLKKNVLNTLISAKNKNDDSRYISYKKLVKEVFVETSTYLKSSKVLKDKNAVILNGNAGMGKTITSYKLLFDMEQKGYIYIRSYDEIQKYTGSKKFVLFIDDAIDSNDVKLANSEKVNRNFDYIISANKNFKVIINTRTMILKTYNNIDSRFNIHKYYDFMVDVSLINNIDKFKILKKHIVKFNKKSLKSLFIKEYESLEYPIKKIVKDKNYQPRVIERIKENYLNKNINLTEMLIKSLEDSDFIYFDEFNKLDDKEREILIFAYLYGEDVNYLLIKSHFSNINERELLRLLDNLIDSFLMKDLVKDNDILYGFYNPGIKDFIRRITSTEPGLEHYLEKYDNYNIIIQLLENTRISDQDKINAISKSNHKSRIITSYHFHKEFIYKNFKKDIIDISIEKRRIPFAYKYSLNSEDIKYINSKIPFLDHLYISNRFINKIFEDLIRENSNVLIKSEIINKIEEDFIDQMITFFYEEIMGNLVINNDVKEEDYIEKYNESYIDDILEEEYKLYLLNSIYDLMNEITNYYYEYEYGNLNDFLKYYSNENNKLNVFMQL